MRSILLALAMLWTPVAFAEPVSCPQLTDPLPGSNSTTADLVRLVVPDIGSDNAGASGSGVIDIRHIDDGDMVGIEPVSVESLQIAAISVRSGGLGRVALLLNLGESKHDVADYVVLALFDVTGEPRLLDAAYVGFDRYTSFWEPARLSVGIGNDRLSDHTSCTQGRQRCSVSTPSEV